MGQLQVGTGAAPGAGGVQHLARLLGRGRAMEVILGAADFSADEAERYGWVNRRCPTPSWTRSWPGSRLIASFPAEAVTSTKQVLISLTLPGSDAIPRRRPAVPATGPLGRGRTPQASLFRARAADPVARSNSTSATASDPYDILPRLKAGGFQLLRRWEQQVRFAVHGPGNPVASPRSHGVPRRDVDGRVHVRVAGETAGSAHGSTAWLSRESRSTCPHAEHRWLVNAGLTFSTRPGALSCSRRTSSPHPDPRIPRFSPALAPDVPARVLPACLSRTGSCSRSAGPRPGSRRTAAPGPC